MANNGGPFPNLEARDMSHICIDHWVSVSIGSIRNGIFLPSLWQMAPSFPECTYYLHRCGGGETVDWTMLSSLTSLLAGADPCIRFDDRNADPINVFTEWLL